MATAAAGARRAIGASGAAVTAGLAGLLAPCLFFGGGSGEGSLLWLGGGAAVLVAAALLLGAPVTRAALPVAAALAALAVVSGASVAWSVAPDRSWDAANRELVYLVFLLLGVVAAGLLRGRACRGVAAALAAALAATLGWALATKAVPALFEDGARAARLRSPVGYWNALALAADFALPLGLWVALRRRALGAALVYGAILAILLATSRTGVVAGGAAVALWLWLVRDRVEAALVGLAAALPAAAVAGWVFTRPALVEDGRPLADRVADGLWFALLALAGAALAAAAATRAHVPENRRRTVGRGLAAGAAAVAAAGLVALTASVGNPVTWAAEAFAGTPRGEVEQGPGRLRSLGSNNRWEWWGEAWRIAAEHPVGGAGANSFELARKRYREDALSVTQPHSVPLQFLAGTGVVGLALFLALVAAAALAARRALARVDGVERPAAAALAAVGFAYLVHALADYDWDFLAVTGPALAAVGALAAAAAPAAPVPRRAALAGAVLAAAAVASLAAPWLAERKVDASLRALERADLAAAVAAARSAERLDPLSLAPVVARARVEEVRGDGDAAREAYEDAVRLQPENPAAWYELGLFELDALRDPCDGYAYLNRAYTLDPRATHWTKGGPLDRARDAVNAGACER